MKKLGIMVCCLALLLGCKKDLSETNTENLSEIAGKKSESKHESVSFSEIGSIDIGNLGAAEISAYDPQTKRLFVVNNDVVNKIDIIDMHDPSHMVFIGSISVAPYGGLVNSLSVSDGKLAAAIEAINKTDPGKVVVFKTKDYSEIKVIQVGSMPDMVTFSPNGDFILSANEGEPNPAYTIDPPGSVSIISVKENYAVTTLTFEDFASQQTTLMAKGLRVFGPGASFAQDMEPEYIAVSEDSKRAWVTLQENNGIAKINLTTKTITDIFPLGFKDFNNSLNAIDPSDRDGGIFLNPWPVKGIYAPDGIAVLVSKGKGKDDEDDEDDDHDNNKDKDKDKHLPYLFTANEGDARDLPGFSELRRIATLNLDPTAFPSGAFLKDNTRLGRLNVTSTLGNPDGDNDYDQLYSFGGRSFSVWNGNTGAQIFDSHNELDRKAVENNAYDDARSDDKSIEPEGIETGTVGKRDLLFIALERANAVAVYDVTNPATPFYLQWLPSGIGPEGVLFVPADESPNKRSLLIISSEVDGVIKVYSTPGKIL